MDKLQWFKFTPTDWIMGKIQRCPEITQARFMRLICLYWNKECILSYDDAEIEIDKEHLDILIAKKIVRLVDEFISIEFLNEQLVNISETSDKRREAVLQRWAKVKQNNTSVLQVNTSVLQNDTDKSREELDKSREDNIKPTAFSFFNSLISLGANKQLVNDWIAVRKTKKATNTETAFNKFKKEFELSGHTIDEVLEKCVEKSWSGFNADWFKKENVNLQPNGIGRTNQKLMIYKND
jgi:hypothetical protein